MGALTFKTYPFELRNWEIYKLKSFDPTDNYISPTIIYLNKNNVIQQIESVFNLNYNNWLNDKAKHFFDTFFNVKKTKTKWFILYNKILLKIYIFEHCSRHTNKNYLFTIIFDYLNIELLGLLFFLSKKYSFVNLKYAQSLTNINTDFELNFQMNDLTNNKPTINSSLCLLVVTNPRNEGSCLHLNLRQKLLKKEINCILVGSLINLLCSITFLGTSLNIIKTLTEGNHFLSQNFRNSINPLLIHNSELFKRTDSKTVNKIFKMLFYLKRFNNTWCGYNILSSSINETGILMINQTLKLTCKDLVNFSLVYFLNNNVNKMSHIKKITELFLLKKISTKNVYLNKHFEKRLVLNQNDKKSNNFKWSSKTITEYLHIPITTFYESSNTFVNTEGLIIKTKKVIYTNKKNDWQILRKVSNYFKSAIVFFNKTDNQGVFFNLKKFYVFKNYINFNYCSIKKLTHLSCFFSNKNKIFKINNYKWRFKTKFTKCKITKLKYFLHTFFTNTKDKYSLNSTLLVNLSKQIKHQTSNFF